MQIKRRGVFFYVAFASIAYVFGVQFNSVPDYEVCATTKEPFRYCADGGLCRINYRIVVGNTGNKTQENVALKFSAAAFEHVGREPVARAQGITVRSLKGEVRDGSQIYYLGQLAPKQYVDVEFILEYMRSDDIPEWKQLLRGVHAANGSVLNADPRSMRFTRALARALDVL